MAQLNSFWRSAAERPERTAVVAADGRRVGAGELAAGCNRLVQGLRKQGLERGSTVVLALPNSPEVLEIYLGTYGH